MIRVKHAKFSGKIPGEEKRAKATKWKRVMCLRNRNSVCLECRKCQRNVGMKEKMMQKKALERHTIFFPSLSCSSLPERVDIKAFLWCLGWRQNGVGSNRNINLTYFQIVTDKTKPKSCFVFSAFCSWWWKEIQLVRILRNFPDIPPSCFLVPK